MAPVSAITALMKLWPTRVRTGVPPISRMMSGTAREQMRLWTTDSPGWLARMPLATIGVAVEGQADVGLLLADGGLEVAQVLGLDRVGRVVRERAVELGEEDRQV